jgi:hypothetical protein
MLAASTRNGATLKLKVGTIGYFSNAEVEKNISPTFVENSHKD